MSLVCHSYVICIYSYVICIPFMCTCMSFVCHLYVTCIYSYITRTSLVCTLMSFVCHSYALVCGSTMNQEENMLIFNTCSFQKKMLSNLTCLLIYSLTKCALREVTVFRVPTFWTNRSSRYNILRIYEIFNITNSTNHDCQM